MTDWINGLANWLNYATSDEIPAEIVDQIYSAPPADLEVLLNVVSASADTARAGTARRWRTFMQHVAVQIRKLCQPHSLEQSIIASDLLIRLYELLSNIDDLAAAHVLQILASQGDEESLDALTSQLTEQPPTSTQAVGVALSPLWNLDSERLEFFFERLGDGFVHPATMASLLDLANYAKRCGKIVEHPWSHRSGPLADLLKSVVQRLDLMQEDPRKFGDSVEAIQYTLNESVALTVSLCDTLGFVGDKDAKTMLRLAMELSHRRVQSEAAGALARLGETTGKEKIVQLASDPIARLRAVAYAEELGFADEIDEALRLPQALAEAELATWLAAPDRFGIAPDALELFDCRTMYWPSYEEPRDCYLFRYSYELSSGSMSNIGIAGPFTFAFNSDLANLPPDDIYAAFAGWQAEHDEIYEVPTPLLNPPQLREADRLASVLSDQGFEVRQQLALTFFFGEVALLAKVQKDARDLCAITDGSELLIHPISNHPQAMTPDLILAIHRGRKLLRTFNS